jgi:hypothetical protein
MRAPKVVLVLLALAGASLTTARPTASQVREARVWIEGVTCSL